MCNAAHADPQLTDVTIRGAHIEPQACCLYRWQTCIARNKRSVQAAALEIAPQFNMDVAQLDDFTAC